MDRAPPTNRRVLEPRSTNSTSPPRAPAIATPPFTTPDKPHQSQQQHQQTRYMTWTPDASYLPSPLQTAPRKRSASDAFPSSQEEGHLANQRVREMTRQRQHQHQHQYRHGCDFSPLTTPPSPCAQRANGALRDAEKLQLRLRLARYKVRTGQTNVPLERLERRPVVARDVIAVVVGAKRARIERERERERERQLGQGQELSTRRPQVQEVQEVEPERPSGANDNDDDESPLHRATAPAWEPAPREPRPSAQSDADSYAAKREAADFLISLASSQ